MHEWFLLWALGMALLWGVVELIAWLRKHEGWPQELGFKSRDPDDLFRACEGSDLDWSADAPSPALRATYPQLSRRAAAPRPTRLPP